MALGRSPVALGRSPVAADLLGWHNVIMDATTVTMGKQGRVVIPAEIRERLGLHAGDLLHLRLAGTQLVLERPIDAVAGLRQIGARLPRTRSLVDELLAERRAAAELE